MRTISLVTLGLLAITGSLLAGPPAVELETKQFGQMVFVLAKTDGKKVKFVALDKGLERVPSEFVPQTDKSAVFYAEFGGDYKILAYTATGDEPSEPAVKTVTVKGAEPAPPPVPPVPPGPQPNPPTPAPTPTPGSKTFWLIVVEDDDGPNPDEAKILNDEAFWAELRGRGHSYRQYRPSSQDAVQKKYVEQGQSVGLPALLLVERESGKPPAAKAKLPTSRQAINDLITKAGGK